MSKIRLNSFIIIRGPSWIWKHFSFSFKPTYLFRSAETFASQISKPTFFWTRLEQYTSILDYFCFSIISRILYQFSKKEINKANCKKLKNLSHSEFQLSLMQKLRKKQSHIAYYITAIFGLYFKF